MTETAQRDDSVKTNYNGYLQHFSCQQQLVKKFFENWALLSRWLNKVSKYGFSRPFCLNGISSLSTELIVFNKFLLIFLSWLPPLIQVDHWEQNIDSADLINLINIIIQNNFEFLHLPLWKLDGVGMWRGTDDMWHVTRGAGWTFSPNFSSLALMVWERQCFEEIFTNVEWVSQWRRCLWNSPGYTGSKVSPYSTDPVLLYSVYSNLKWFCTVQKHCAYILQITVHTVQ